ncbi:MAG: DUF3810 domain-containing protein [Ruminococcaceae bacterium]|nr:DUF3810 domain-containing protein [Oscillospiraceae bacterium]
MKKNEKIISPFDLISFLVFIPVMLLYLLASASQTLADTVNSGVSQQFRKIMASFGEFFPFSLFEVFVFFLPLILFLIIYVGIKRFSSLKGGIRFLINLLALVLLIYSGHILALGIGYKTTPIAEKMELPETSVTAENLKEVMISLCDEVNSLADTVPRNQSGVFEPEYSYSEISEKILASYSTLESKYGFAEGFYSTAKGVKAGNLMSYLGISGIYTYITGEANVNTAFPAYDTIFTAAHEMSHQRGVLREDEANFTAYLLTSTSPDPSIRYSAALSMYGYIASALYRTDREAYIEVARGLSESAITDIRASNAVIEKYGDTVIADISEWVNDLYLESNGTDGVVSYSQVVTLTVAYFEKNK